MSSHFAASHRSTRRLAVFLATTVCLPVLAVPFVDVAAAQEGAVAVRYEIAAGPLPQALNRFADVAGLQLIYDAAATRSLRTDGFRGEGAAPEVIAKLLSGTGLTWRFTSRNSVTIISPSATASGAVGSDDATVLQPIILSSGQSSEDSYSLDSSATATRISADIQKTPRSVNVVTQRQMIDRGVSDLEEAIAYSPGVATGLYGNDDRYDQYVIRGFETQNVGTYRDGMPLRTFGWAAWRTEPFGLERLDILRGPTSDLYGSNEPGGLVNAVTKRPNFEPSNTVFGRLSSYGGTEAGIDSTGPIGDDFDYRFVGVANRSGTNYDEVDQGRFYVAPSLTWKPEDTTSLTLFAEIQRDDVGDSWSVVPEYGSRRHNPLGHFSPDTYTGLADHNSVKTRQTTIGYEFEHEFETGITFHSKARYAENDWRMQTAVPAAFVSLPALFGVPGADPSAVDTALLSKFDLNQKAYQASFDNNLSYEFESGDLSGTIVVGFDHYLARSDVDYAQGYLGELNLFTGDLTNFLSGALPTDLPAILNNDIDQTGVYLTSRSEFENLVFSGGIRHDWVTSSTETSAGKITSEGQVTSASFGVAWNFDDAWTIYGNAAYSFNVPPAGVTASGAALDMEKSRAYEIGLRYNLPDDRGHVNVALFDTTKLNATYNDPSDLTGITKIQAGKVRSMGVDVDALLELSHGFTVLGSYTYVDAEVTKDPTLQGKKPARAPVHSASAWVKYDVQAPALEGLSLGVGIRHVGSYFSDAINIYDISSANLLDASISYQRDGWSLVLAARNLANKEYEAECNTATFAAAVGALADYAGSCTYNEGRRVMLTASRRF